MLLHIKRPSGVYQIILLPTKQVYIGSTSNFDLRWKRHREDLRLQKHANYRLQEAWNRYGESAFLFEIVEYTVPQRRYEREQVWIDKLNPYFNIQRIVQVPNPKVYQKLQSARQKLYRRHVRPRYSP